MILGIVGQKGHGKTRKAVSLAKDNFDRGRDIISNIHLEFKHLAIQNVSEVGPDSDYGELRDCFLLLDEVHMMVDSRRAMKGESIDWSYFILQTRKLDVDLVWTTQFLNQPDVRLRNATDGLITSLATRFEDIEFKGRMRNLATEFQYTLMRPNGEYLVWQEKLGVEKDLYDSGQLVRKGPSPFAKPAPAEESAGFVSKHKPRGARFAF